MIESRDELGRKLVAESETHKADESYKDSLLYR